MNEVGIRAAPTAERPVDALRIEPGKYYWYDSNMPGLQGWVPVYVQTWIHGLGGFIASFPDGFTCLVSLSRFGARYNHGAAAPTALLGEEK